MLYLYNFRKFVKLAFFMKRFATEKYQILVKNSGTFLPGGYSKSGLPLIKKEDYEILYGLILGDAYISRKNTENASLRFEQSIIHKEYLKHLFDN